MHSGRSFAFVMMFSLLAARTAHAGDETSSAKAVSETLHLADTILEHHVLPPTRQEMLLAALRKVYRDSRPPLPLDLSRQMSDAESPDELRSIMEHQLDPLLAQRVISQKKLAETLREGLFTVIPGEIRLANADSERVAEQFRSNRYVGTGIHTGMRDGGPTMVKVVPGGPAHSVGALDGDRIETIDGESTEGMSLERVVELLRGPEGSDVHVTLRQPEEAEPRVVTITRGVVLLQSIAGYEIFPAGADAVVAYLNVERLTASCAHELEQYREKLERDGVHGLILDLRLSQSGRVHDAVILANAFLDGKEIGRVRTLAGDHSYVAEPGELFPDLKIGVLVGPYTRAAMEWLAAALQDNERAVIFGELTPGQAMVSEAVSFGNDDQVLILPTALLERPSGHALLRTEGAQNRDVAVAELFFADGGTVRWTRAPWGVQPDVPLATRGRPGEDRMAMPAESARQLPDATPGRSTNRGGLFRENRIERNHDDE